MTLACLFSARKVTKVAFARAVSAGQAVTLSNSTWSYVLSWLSSKPVTLPDDGKEYHLLRVGKDKPSEPPYVHVTKALIASKQELARWDVMLHCMGFRDGVVTDLGLSVERKTNLNGYAGKDEFYLSVAELE